MAPPTDLDHLPPALAELDSSHSSSTSYMSSDYNLDGSSYSPVKKTTTTKTNTLIKHTSSSSKSAKMPLPPMPRQAKQKIRSGGSSSSSPSSPKTSSKKKTVIAARNVVVVEDDEKNQQQQQQHATGPPVRLDSYDLTKWTINRNANSGGEVSSTSVVSTESSSSSSSSTSDEEIIVISSQRHPREEATTATTTVVTPTANSDNTTAAADNDEDDDEILRMMRDRVVTIRFAPRNETFGIESHRDYNSKERSRCWYSPKDKERMMNKHERVVARMELKKPPKTKNQTYRGLEAWTIEGAHQLDQVIAISVNAVMDEQDLQWKSNVDDYDRIAAKSIEVTADSARRARIVGIEDHQEALAVRRLPWTDSPDDASVGSSMTSTSVKNQMAANKRKKLSAKKRERLEEGDKGKSKTRTRRKKSSSSSSSSKSKNNKNKKKSTKSSSKSSSSKKSGLKISDKLSQLDTLSQSEHLENNYTTPSLQALISSTTSPTTNNNSTAADDSARPSSPADYGPSDLLASLRKRRSAAGGDTGGSAAVGQQSLSATSSFGLPNNNDDDNATVDTRMSKDPPGRRVIKTPSGHGSETLDAMQRKVETMKALQLVGDRVASNNDHRLRDGSSRRNRDLRQQLHRSLSSPQPQQQRKQGVSVSAVVTPPSSPIGSPSRTSNRLRRFSSPEAARKLLNISRSMSPSRLLRKRSDNHE